MDIDLSFIKEEYFVKKIENYLNRLFDTYLTIMGIILFGSLAKDTAQYSSKKVSDIDLMIIFKDDEIPRNHKKRTALQINLMDLTELSFDSIWLTESEFKNMVQIKADIILDALNDGIILFDPINLVNETKNRLFRELKEKGVIKREHYWIWPIKNLGDEIEW